MDTDSALAGLAGGLVQLIFGWVQCCLLLWPEACFFVYLGGGLCCCCFCCVGFFFFCVCMIPFFSVCFDFHPFSEHLFLVGTEEGYIHKCSKAYNSQYSATYFGHYMAVYKVQWNPYHRRIFLSASADWTVKIWDHEKQVSSFDYSWGNPVVVKFVARCESFMNGPVCAETCPVL
mgnify:CR=1 FL=1